MQEDRTELVTSLLFFHFFRTATPPTQETRPRWWVKRRIRAASEGRPAWDRGRCWGLVGGSPSPRVRWGPAGRGPRRGRLPPIARTLPFSPQPCGGDNSGQLRRAGGRPGGLGEPGWRAERRGGSGPGPREGPAQRPAAPRGVGSGPPRSPPTPQPPRPSRESSPTRPPAAAPTSAARRPLTATGCHLALRAATWAALGRAGKRAHLSPTSAALAGRVLRKRPPAPSRLPPAAASPMTSACQAAPALRLRRPRVG